MGVAKMNVVTEETWLENELLHLVPTSYDSVPTAYG